MRILQARLKRPKIQNIFISHFDTDHYSGLMGLPATLQLQRREIPLRIVGPVGIKEYVEWNVNFAKLNLGFELHFVEIEEDIDSQIVVDEEEYYVEARPLNHTMFCVGYRFKEKDKTGKEEAEKSEALDIMEE